MRGAEREPSERASTPLPSGDDHAFGVAVIDALIEIAMGNDGLEACVLESLESFLEAQIAVADRREDFFSVVFGQIAIVDREALGAPLVFTPLEDSLSPLGPFGSPNYAVLDIMSRDSQRRQGL
jgi:hypothetical protein